MATERALNQARDEAIASRVEALEAQPKPISASTSARSPEPGSEKTLEKINQIEEAFRAFQRETSGIIDSHKATVSALDQHTRLLEARLKKLELAVAPPPIGPNPPYEAGTPPAPRTGKRDQRNDDEPEEGGADKSATNGNGETSMQPSPAKRPRFDDIEQTTLASSLLEESLRNDLREEEMLANLVKGDVSSADTEAQSGPDTQQLRGTSAPGSQSIDIDSISADGQTSGQAHITSANPSPQGTINPASFMGRPIAALRRSSSSKASATPKNVRTSALSFGQALKSNDTSLSNSSMSPTTSTTAFPPLDFGTPFSASTPAVNRDQNQRQGPIPGSPDVSFGAGFQFPSGFTFGGTMQPPALPLPSTSSSAVTPSTSVPPSSEKDKNADEGEPDTRGGSGAGPNVLSSPAFPIDNQPRYSTEFDFGMGAGAETFDLSPPPSPSKRTNYGTEVTTPLRQAYFGDRAAVKSRLFGDAEVRGREGERKRPVGFGLGAPTLDESDESMSLDETSSAFVPVSAPSLGAAHHGDVFGGSANVRTGRANISPSQPSVQLPNPSPTRYGLDNPLSWGTKPKKGPDEF